ncbi:MAG: DUF3592 domain-containing protein [Betaproteobacteria bacterium]|nr:MAG: DUF3592 domain-containing protein [Betaproteobacteria bacterium]
MGSGGTLASKLLGLAAAALFAVGFTTGGFFGGIVPLWTAAQSYSLASSLVPVEAKLRSVELARGSKATVGIRAQYTYTWQGERYASDQVSLQQSKNSTDNIGDWHEKWFAVLSAAHKNQATITAWINPAKPSEAVLDKEIRWAKVWFAIPFATLFTGVGLGAAYVFLMILFGNGKQPVSQPRAPTKSAPNDNRIRANSDVGLFFFGVVWSLMAVPICVLVWSNQSDAIISVFITVFAAAGLWMMVFGLSSWVKSKKKSTPSVALTPSQPEFGEAFRVRIHVPNHRRVALPNAMAIALQETVRDERGSSATIRAGAKKSFLATRAVSTPSTATEVLYEATVIPPRDGHASGGPSGGLIYSWTLQIEASERFGAASFSISMPPSQAESAKFQKIPIGEAKDFTDAYRELRQSNHDALTTFVPKIVCKISQQGRQWQADFPARGLTAGPATALLIALGVMSWVFYRLIYAQGDVLGNRIANATMALIALIALFMALHYSSLRTRVKIDTAGLVIRRESSLMATRICVPLAHLKNFASRRQHTRANLNRTEEFSAVHAFETKHGLHHTVTPTLSGIGAVDALSIEMNDALDAVRQFGITPAPSHHEALCSPTRRLLSWGLLSMVALLTAAMALTLLYDRQKLSGALAVARAEPFPDDLAAAQFTPADTRRHEAIMDAVSRNDVAAMRKLLSEGVDPNTEAHHGSSLLHMAVARAKTEMIDVLLAGGADINRAVTRGRQSGATPLSVSIYYANPALMSELIARGARPRGLVYYGWEYANLAAFSGCIDCLKRLKQEGIDLDAFAPGGRRETPIMTAARYSKLDAITYLASAGASLSKRDQHGYNVMGWAHFFKQDAAKSLLLSLGADPDIGEKITK